ncbi:MAG TPA: histidinol-phosphatase [Candidatus Elarobacter sp.]|nr:histidinol-phosphatase [Candidatus Elarobacter sp.]
MSAPYFDAVAEVAKLAGDFAMSHYGRELMVDVKSDGSPVTVADRGAEERARAWIERNFPDDGILGEEFGDVRPDARRRWIIDPIDGTKSFVRTVPLWGTLIAVTEGESVLAGCAYFPALGETVVAAPGAGCFWNGARCSVSTVDRLEAATIVVTDDRFPEREARGVAWHRLVADAAVVRTWGDCYGYLLLATGRADVMLDDVVSPWDAAALYPIITEAGGVFTDWRGRATAFGGDVIATNAALAEGVRNILIP